MVSRSSSGSLSENAIWIYYYDLLTWSNLIYNLFIIIDYINERRCIKEYNAYKK